MNIKKIYQGKLPDNKILNEYSTSQTNTYSCDMINDMIENTDVIVEETDPTVPQYIKDITEEDITKWNNKAMEVDEDSVPINAVIEYDGDEVPDGYELVIEDETEAIIEETDPTVPEHVKAITEEDIAKWNNNSGEIVEQDTIPINTIVEYNGDEVPDGYELVTDEDDYDSTEVVVGTWFGKPIYRKSFKFGSTLPTYITSKIDDLISCNMVIFSSGAWRHLPFSFTNTDTGEVGEAMWTGGFHVAEGGNILYFLGSAIGKVEKGTAIFEYTKTTD